MDLAGLSLLALVVVIIVSCTTRANPGLVAIVLAWAIVVYAAPWFRLPAGQSMGLKTLFAGFPVDLFLTLLGVSLLFTQAEVNGTLVRVAGVAQKLCRGNRGLIPIMFFLLAMGLGTVGPGNIAVAGLIAPVAMASAERVGISPLLMALMVGHGAIACTLSPFTAAGIVADDILVDMGVGGNEWRVFLYNALANAAVGFGGYLLFGGWKLFRRQATEDQKAAAELLPQQVEPGAFNVRHWVTIGVILALVVGVVVGGVHIGMGAFAGAALLSILRMADERETFLKLPWSVIIMVCGVSVLTALLSETGGIKRFAELVSAVSTPGSATGVLALATGLVSVFSSTTGVVLPAFLPMVKDLAQLEAGSDPLALALAVLVGGNLVDMSPLSTIGALCLAGSPASVDRRRLYNQMLAWGFALAIIGAVLCWILFGLAWRG